MALVFRAEVCAAADFEAVEPDLAAVLDAADAAFFDAAEAAFVEVADVARDLIDAVVTLRDVTRRDVAARLLAVCLAGRAARALDFEALVLTDEVFTELFRTEALAIVFALLVGALDATGFEGVVFAVFDVALAAALVLGGMVGTLPG